MKRQEKIAEVHKSGKSCVYCTVREHCTGGTQLTPNGISFPPCVDNDYSEYFDEKRWNADHPQTGGIYRWTTAF